MATGSSWARRCCYFVGDENDTEVGHVAPLNFLIQPDHLYPSENGYFGDDGSWTFTR
jgi:hypothetical protein